MHLCGRGGRAAHLETVLLYERADGVLKRLPGICEKRVGLSQSLGSHFPVRRRNATSRASELRAAAAFGEPRTSHMSMSLTPGLHIPRMYLRTVLWISEALRTSLYMSASMRSRSLHSASVVRQRWLRKPSVRGTFSISSHGETRYARRAAQTHEQSTATKQYGAEVLSQRFTHSSLYCCISPSGYFPDGKKRAIGTDGGSVWTGMPGRREERRAVPLSVDIETRTFRFALRRGSRALTALRSSRLGWFRC